MNQALRPLAKIQSSANGHCVLLATGEKAPIVAVALDSLGREFYVIGGPALFGVWPHEVRAVVFN
jgi:hypothetical protein